MRGGVSSSTFAVCPAGSRSIPLGITTSALEAATAGSLFERRPHNTKSFFACTSASLEVRVGNPHVGSHGEPSPFRHSAHQGRPVGRHARAPRRLFTLDPRALRRDAAGSPLQARVLRSGALYRSTMSLSPAVTSISTRRQHAWREAPRRLALVRLPCNDRARASASVSYARSTLLELISPQPTAARECVPAAGPRPTRPSWPRPVAKRRRSTWLDRGHESHRYQPGDRRGDCDARAGRGRRD